MFKKIISYCLYGENPRYYIGIEKNLNIANKMLSDWICFVYHDDTVPETIISKLNNYKNIKLIKINDMINHGMFWRFLPFFENENNISISRDADSRITEREVVCINKWLNSHEKFHIIKDHAQHYNMPIMGGMWGMKGKMDEIMLQNMKKFVSSGGWYYGKDQEWLSSLWGFVQRDCLIHGIRETTWLKESRNKMKDLFNFIGNGWTENDKPIYHYGDCGQSIN